MVAESSSALTLTLTSDREIVLTREAGAAETMDRLEEYLATMA